MKLNGKLEIAEEAIADFCQKWRISELSLFGSVLRDDFGPDSDIDVLVEFGPDSHVIVFDYVGVKDYIATLTN